ncbi:IS66 family insertion sequence element accessory protein TnpB [Parapedobacter deserti]|uniref:IS66 family insertion sequence element accessory protein TnpB n=1 Tax=Parapedobacter deserti TaxID=1912957 RepID=UPI003671FE2E
MFSLGSSHRYYLYNGHCDMRKSFDGLCGLLSSGLGRGATGGDVFVFVWNKGTYGRMPRQGHKCNTCTRSKLPKPSIGTDHSVVPMKLL